MDKWYLRNQIRFFLRSFSDFFCISRALWRDLKLLYTSIKFKTILICPKKKKKDNSPSYKIIKRNLIEIYYVFLMQIKWWGEIFSILGFCGWFSEWKIIHDRSYFLISRQINVNFYAKRRRRLMKIRSMDFSLTLSTRLCCALFYSIRTSV